MSQPLVHHIRKKLPSMDVHIVPTEKFKTNTIAIRMKAPLEEETHTLRALLPYVLQSATEQFPSQTEVRAHLENLYGASFFVDVAKKGEQQVITYYLELVNEHYLVEGENLLEQAFAFLQQVTLFPRKEGNGFVRTIVESEKRNLKQRIQAVYDDKMKYASQRLVEEMCKNEPYSLSTLGCLEGLQNITAENLYEYYEASIKTDDIDVYVIGNVDADNITHLCETYLTYAPRERQAWRDSAKHQPITEAREVVDVQDINQGKLNIGYRTNVTYRDPDYFALQLFNGIFGGFSHSKLFINVREKASLAYYAASRYESHKGLMFVMSGIQTEKFGQAKEIIEKQMQEMKQGNFTEEEIKQTKAVIVNQLLESIDTARGLVELLYHNAVAQVEQPFEEWIECINNVTREQIIAVGQKIECDTVYFLSGKEGGTK